MEGQTEAPHLFSTTEMAENIRYAGQQWLQPRAGLQRGSLKQNSHQKDVTDATIFQQRGCRLGAQKCLF